MMIRRRLVLVVVTALSLARAGVGAAQAPARPGGMDAARLMQTVETLSDPGMEGRRTGTPGGLRARAWVRAAMEETGLKPAGADLLLPFSFTASSGQRIEGANIAVACEGTSPELPVFVVSAHYDHVGIRDGRVYRGADDNASGVAVLLELARRCAAQPFRHTVLFVAFDAEEQGLRGARAFVAAPPVPRDRIGLNVNLDMVARGDRGELYAAGTQHYPALRPVLEKVASGAPVKLLFGHDRPGTGADDWTQQSDHGPFHDAKIPFVYFGVEDHPDYHQPTDTPEKIDRAFFAHAGDTILAALTALDRERP